MVLKITNTGVWNEYTPETMPEIPGVPADTSFPPGMRFSRNGYDEDWYVFRASWPENALCVQAWPRKPADPASVCDIQSALWDARDMAVPFGCRVLKIEGYDPTDLAPWREWQFKVYDPTTGLIAAANTNVGQVSAVQAEIQLSRMMMADGKTTVLNALLAILPGAGLETNLWYKRAQNWRIDDPNVKKLGAALGISADAMQAAFNEAAKIGV